MKKTLIILSLCCISVLVQAQDFGKTLITGSIGYSTYKAESTISSNSGSENSRFSFYPKIGFFVSPRVAVGLAAGLETYSSPQNVGIIVNGQYESITLDQKSRSYDVGPFVRVYQALGSKAAFFGQANAYYRYGKSEYEDAPNAPGLSSTSKGGGVNLSPGFVFFPTDKIGLEFTMGTIGYSQLKSESEGSSAEYKSKSFDANLGLSSVTLGVSLYLGRTAAE
ncbi:hypothetical protein ACFSC6_18900 [Rufibacter sediminis]|uniref:Outer membrane protein beta-barrel domain-containing protein n=1 Tax=Rufibacter sediminis TaxID=2762756 RepID=A0ABR6VQW3_9BACT|nr:hypothetical protein [Rufibacter sediminis]MBC3539596.1 hypothetical protein [Rufibacter sediminis]